MAPDPHGKNRPRGVPDGTYLVVGHPKQASKVDGEKIDVDATEDGVFSYTAVNGAVVHVKKYNVIKTYE